MQSVLVQSVRVLILELIKEIIYFPFWWYSGGLKKSAFYLWRSVQKLGRNLSIKLMITHLFRPMFGQYDKAGRIISFFMRLLMLISRLVVFILFTLLYLLFFIFWLILPILVTIQLVRNFSFLWPT